MVKARKTGKFDENLVRKIARRLSECVDDQGRVEPC